MSPMPKRTKPEGRNVKAPVRKLLDGHGWFWWFPPANAYGQSTVDIMAFRTGVLIAIETKWHNRELTANQRAFLNSVRAENGFGFVVREGEPGSKYDVHGVAWLKDFLHAFDNARDAAMRKVQVDPGDGASMLNAIKALTEEL